MHKILFLLLPLVLAGCVTTGSIGDLASNAKVIASCMSERFSSGEPRDCDQAVSVAEAERKATLEIATITKAVEEAAALRGVKSLGVQVAQIPVMAGGRRQASVAVLRQAAIEAKSDQVKPALDVMRDAAREIAPMRFTPVTVLIVRRGEANESAPKLERAGEGEIRYVLATAPDVPKGVSRVIVAVRGVNYIEVK